MGLTLTTLDWILGGGALVFNKNSQSIDEIPLPKGSKAVMTAAQTESAKDRKSREAVAESLLRNVYRAFDYHTDSDIYDALARKSVAMTEAPDNVSTPATIAVLLCVSMSAPMRNSSGSRSQRSRTPRNPSLLLLRTDST